MAASDITRETLKSLVNYDPSTGVFTWIKSKRRYVGTRAGTNISIGYRQISFKKMRYYEHRLAWLYVYGVWPVGDVDHINGIRDDNRIENLRVVTRSENLQNRRHAGTTSKSGLLGASWHQPMKAWLARISVNGETIKLGYFASAEGAHEAYVKAKRKLHSTCTI